MGLWIEGGIMFEIQVEEQSLKAYTKEINDVNSKIARNITLALNTALHKEKDKYERLLRRYKKNQYKGRRRGHWVEFYKRIADVLYAEDIEPVAVGSFLGGPTSESLFSVNTGFFTTFGSRGEELTGLYYYGKDKGDPTTKRAYAKATKGNPVMHSLIRGQAQGAYSNKFLQSADGGGKYPLPEGYVSKGWDNRGKEQFNGYLNKIRKAFETEGERVLRGMNK